MHNAIAHLQLTDAQPVPEQQPPASFPPSSHAECDAIWSGISLWSVGVSCPGCVPSQDLAHPVPLWEGGKCRKEPWCCVSTTQQ